MPFNKDRNSRDDNSGKDHKKSNRSESTGRSNREEGNKSPFDKFRKEDSSFSKDKKPYGDKRESSGDRKPYGTRDSGNSYGDRKPYGDKRENSGDRKPYGTRDSGNSYGDRRENSGDRKPRERQDFDGNKPFRPKSDEDRKPFVSSDKSFSKEEGSFGRGERSNYKNRDGNTFRKRSDDYSKNDRDEQVRLKSHENKATTKKDDGLIRLNRFIANAGICSRRKADDLIASGVIKVNEEVVTELGTKVDPAKDQIRHNGELLKRGKMVYVLLNKPKDYITTTDDPQERKTVMELVSKATNERIYPVGRLDRNTTGLLLLTNDGDLAEKLSHPKNSISKIYNVELNKNLTQGDFNKIAFGIELEDGLIKPDEVRYVTGGSKNEIGIQIHSGKNRIVRRIFESLGYEVEKLDRVIYANLTKKDLTRGRWRYLTEKEVIQLKHFTKNQ